MGSWRIGALVAAVVIVGAVVIGGPPAGAVSAGVAHDVPNTQYLNAVACNPSGGCFAIAVNPAGNPEVVPITDVHTGATGTPIVIPGVQLAAGIACPTTTTCLVVGTVSISSGGGYVVAVTNGVAGPVQTIAGTTPGAVASIACATAATCVAVGGTGTDGVVVPVDGTSGTPGVPHVVSDAAGLAKVACPTTTSCLAVGVGVSTSSPFDQAAVTPITDLATGATGATQVESFGSAPSNFSDIACPTSSACIAVGAAPGGGMTTPITDVTTGALGVPREDGGLPLTGITCANQKCAVVAGSGTNSELAPIVDNATGAVGHLQVFSELYLPQAACVDYLTCAAVGAHNGGGPGGGIILPFDLRAPTTLTATPALLGIRATGANLSSVDVTVSTLILRAQLASGGVGVANEPVTFTAGGSALCRATTAPDGTAYCDALLDPGRALAVLASGGYRVSFPGDAVYGPSAATAPIIGVPTAP